MICIFAIKHNVNHWSIFYSNDSCDMYCIIINDRHHEPCSCKTLCRLVKLQRCRRKRRRRFMGVWESLQQWDVGFRFVVYIKRILMDHHQSSQAIGWMKYSQVWWIYTVVVAGLIACSVRAWTYAFERCQSPLSKVPWVTVRRIGDVPKVPGDPTMGFWGDDKAWTASRLDNDVQRVQWFIEFACAIQLEFATLIRYSYVMYFLYMRIPCTLADAVPKTLVCSQCPLNILQINGTGGVNPYKFLQAATAAPGLQKVR